MKTKIEQFTTGFMRGMLTAALIFMAFKIGRQHDHQPQTGDIYAEYQDNRHDQYALTNGFSPLYVTVFRVEFISNGIAYQSVYLLTPPTNGDIKEFGPLENDKKYRTFIPPNL